MGFSPQTCCKRSDELTEAMETHRTELHENDFTKESRSFQRGTQNCSYSLWMILLSDNVEMDLQLALATKWSCHFKTQNSSHWKCAFIIRLQAEYLIGTLVISYKGDQVCKAETTRLPRVSLKLNREIFLLSWRFSSLHFIANIGAENFRTELSSCCWKSHVLMEVKLSCNWINCFLFMLSSSSCFALQCKLA